MADTRIIGQWSAGDVSELHAFLLLRGAHPTVVTYSDDPEGRAELAEQVREGNVLSVVRGRQLDVRVQSLVTFRDTQTTVADSIESAGYM